MVASSPPADDNVWVLLSHRMPREPSTPRIAVWRKLKELGVAQIGDGLVALPHSAETREQLEWVAAQVLEAGGEAIVWIAEPSGRRNGRVLAAQLREERAAEYADLLAEVNAPGAADVRSVARWRRQLRRIELRDHLRAEGRDSVRLAVDAIAAAEPRTRSGQPDEKARAMTRPAR